MRSGFRLPSPVPAWPRHPLAWLQAPVSPAPLAGFRWAFGLLMLASTLRFWAKGWIDELYLQPDFHFTYYGFDWVAPLPGWGMYALFALVGLSALGVAVGFFYRLSAVLFFLSFTYIELIDKTYYLNHYYFVSLVALLMVFLPAHRAYSWDAWRRPALRRARVPRWTVNLVRLQLGLVYCYAGMAKLNPDWLFEAMPLAIWLPAHYDLPLLGRFFDLDWVQYAFSWGGAAYDLLIPFFLIQRAWRPLAYGAVIGFHLMTAVLFQIGMFPYIMIVATLVFFPAAWHEHVLDKAAAFFRRQSAPAGDASTAETVRAYAPADGLQVAAVWRFLAVVFVVFQLLYPWRYLLYSGNHLWHEQGFRFGWRVMLIEKGGYATFYLREGAEGRKVAVEPCRFLTPYQIKQMSTQPDMILQFAHFLADHYQHKGYENPQVEAEVYVALNGRRSRLLIDPDTNLAAQERGFAPKSWILPLQARSAQSTARR